MSNKGEEFAHIYSFRRTFYGIPEKNAQIPESILIHFEQENHRIFLSTEIKRCTNCHKIGHLSEVCRQKKIDDNSPTHLNKSNEIIFDSQKHEMINNNLRQRALLIQTITTWR